MITKILKPEQFNDIVESLSNGKVVALPTDTVYGVAVVYDNEEALKNLKNAKNRDDNKPIPMMVSSIEQILEIANVDDKYYELMNKLMPGALTIVVRKKEHIADYITNGLDTIAIRMPDDKLVLDIMNTLNKPLLVSSANISNQESCSNSDDVYKQLNGRIDIIVEGKSKSDLASTIIDITTNEYKVLREGIISVNDIEKYL